MFSFNGLAQSLNMVPFTTRPELHKEIILSFTFGDSCDKEKSSVGFEFIRGWYSTWIEGPVTRGCGMQDEAVQRIDPAASRQWSYSMVFLYNSNIVIDEAWLPGVLDEALFERDSWWGYCDAPVADTTLAQYLNLERGRCKTRLKHAGVFYPSREV